MLTIFTFIVVLCILALIVGALFYRELFTRILFLNSLTNLVVVVISMLGSYKYNSSYIDIAIIYACLSFVVSQAILKFVITGANGIR